MQLYNPITKDSIISEVWRICGANENNYTIRDIIARVNSALDRYLHLAFPADARWNFDDINKTSPPIGTQSIVSGTNRYKLSAFTETLLSLIRLEILDSAGAGLFLIPEKMDDLGKIYSGNTSGRVGGISSNTFQELYVNASSGTPTHYIKYGDFIYLRPNPDYSETDGLLAYFNRPASKFEFLAATISNASPGVLTDVAHGLLADDTIMLETDGGLPTGLAVDTVYYVKEVLTANTLTLAATLGGTVINTSSAGSGIHYYVKTSKTPGIPVIHHSYLAQYASLPYLIEKNLDQMRTIASQIAIGEEAIQEYFATRDKDTKPRLEIRQQNNK